MTNTTTELAKLTANLPSLRPFDPKLPAEFGNSLLESMLKASAFDEELQTAIQTGEEVKRYIGFEMTKAVMHAAEANTDLNLFAIFEGNKPVEKLNNRLLQHWGIIKREIKDDDVIIIWTDKKVQDAYDYGAIDKEKNEAEHTKRLNNRKRLNMRLSEAVKSAIALMDNGVKADSLKLVENTTTKQVEPIIENAPDSLRGDKEKNGTTIVFGKRTPNEGAKLAPNMSALVKAATEKHKKNEDTNSRTTGEGARPDKGTERTGDAKLGMSDEDFGGIVNNLKRAISAQEGKFSEEMLKQLRSMVPFINEAVEKAVADAAANAGLSDNDPDFNKEDPNEPGNEAEDEDAVAKEAELPSANKTTRRK